MRRGMRRSRVCICGVQQQEGGETVEGQGQDDALDHARDAFAHELRLLEHLYQQKVCVSVRWVWPV